MSASDEHKPTGVKTETWRDHLEWMRVMESSRRNGPPMDQLMDDHFLPPDEDDSRDEDRRNPE